MTTSTKQRCTCIECEISFGIRPPGTFSPVTCEECTSRLNPSRLCRSCQRIIAVGECFIAHLHLGSLCSICCDDWLRQKENDAYDEYEMEDDELEKQDLYFRHLSISQLRIALKNFKWDSAQRNDAAARVGLEVAQ